LIYSFSFLLSYFGLYIYIYYNNKILQVKKVTWLFKVLK